MLECAEGVAVLLIVWPRETGSLGWQKTLASPGSPLYPYAFVPLSVALRLVHAS
jgi:hypothetical protein